MFYHDYTGRKFFEARYRELREEAERERLLRQARAEPARRLKPKPVLALIAAGLTVVLLAFNRSTRRLNPDSEPKLNPIRCLHPGLLYYSSLQRNEPDFDKETTIAKR